MTSARADESKEEKPPIESQSKRLTGLFHQPKMMGFNCMVYGLASILEWLYNQNAIEQRPLPVRKRDIPGEKSSSLRQVAKMLLEHEVPDILIDEKQFFALATQHPEINLSSINCSTFESYCHTLKKAIDHNLAPLVHFDVNPDNCSPTFGSPTLLKGQRLHGAIVTGYQTTREGKLFFTLYQWQQEFSGISAETLFASANQLPEFSRGTKPDALSFTKLYHRNGQGAWFPLWRKEEFSDLTDPVRPIIRSCKLKEGNGLRNRIILVDSITRTKKLIAELIRYIEFADKKSISPILQLLSLLQASPREVLFSVVEKWKNQSANTSETNWQWLVKQDKALAKIIEDNVRTLPVVARSPFPDSYAVATAVRCQVKKAELAARQARQLADKLNAECEAESQKSQSSKAKERGVCFNRY